MLINFIYTTSNSGLMVMLAEHKNIVIGHSLHIIYTWYKNNDIILAIANLLNFFLDSH